MSSKIVNVDQMDNGVLVNFEDGVRSLFDADFLYVQLDKRLKPSLKTNPGKRSSARPPRDVDNKKRR
jgi:hypothetical protein